MKRYFSPIFLLSGAVMASLAVFSSIYDNNAPIDEAKFKAKSLVPEPKIEWVENQLKDMTLREKIGQFFMVAAYSGKTEDHFRTIDSMVVRDKVGGVIFFQGDRTNLKIAIDRFQGEAKIPLLIGMDAEWGVQMRLSGEERFPYNYTIGAANDEKLTEKIAMMMGQECRELGIHLNFAPVADVNSNPRNPVIGFRSYGESPKEVAKHVAATVKGMEAQGVMTSIKHFPGHGDTDVDSHIDLPVVNNSYEQINAIDFFPFRAGIRAGASTVMIGHLNVPALDPTGTPSSLSEPTIRKYLRGELEFNGLVVSDALGMKAVADRYGKTEVVVKAFEAGCDILLFPESVEEAITAIEKKVKDGEISEITITERCRKLLNAKHKHVVKPTKFKEFTPGEIEWARKQTYEVAITIAKNKNEFYPIKDLSKKIAFVTIGPNAEAISESINLVVPMDHFHFENGNEAISMMKSKLNGYSTIITSLHSNSVRTKDDFGLPVGWRSWLETIPSTAAAGLVLFGNPLALGSKELTQNFESVIFGYENHKYAQERVGQFIAGTYASSGALPITVGEAFKRGAGEAVQWSGRLKESQPEALGIDPIKLAQIDSIVSKSIAGGVFPGCQIVVAVKGQVIYRKSFGHHTYGNNKAVKNDDLYDIASVTKIAASTLSLMKLQSEEKFTLDSRLENYLPDLTANSVYASVKLKDMMAHQAGFTPWIPFYTETLLNKKLNPKYYQQFPSDSFSDRVTSNLYIMTNYQEEMYKQILRTPLKAKSYKYSDVGYYFVKKIVEKQTGRSLDKYVREDFYLPMGLRYICYNPADIYPLDQITPTENDTIFRKQLIHGFVHDQGAAMMGGVGGHAGLFSNASDLAGLMQMYLNKGFYGGVQYIKPEVVDLYTGYQFYPSNRRGAGFDKPVISGTGGTACSLVSKSSYGHSGFTGTLVWSDPEYQINFVFLSNRVYPDAENWKIVKQNTRTEIQRVIYEAVLAAK